MKICMCGRPLVYGSGLDRCERCGKEPSECKCPALPNKELPEDKCGGDGTYTTLPMDTSPRPPQVVHSSGLVASSKVPPFRYLTLHFLERVAYRCQEGVDRKGENLSWNATKPDKIAVAADQSYLLERLEHVIKHALLLRDKIVKGEDPLAGDDDAGAIGWAGMFLCEATRLLHEKHEAIAGQK